jgi:HK97 family phage portal protein
MQPFSTISRWLRKRKEVNIVWRASPRSDGYASDSGRRVPILQANDAGYSLAYKAISDVFACVNLRAESIARLNIKVVRKGTDIEVDKSPWHEATMHAMNVMEQDLLYLLEYGLSIWGEAYLLKLLQDDGHTPGGLQWLNPQAVELVIEDGYLVGFEYQGGDGRTLQLTRDMLGYYHYRDSDDDNVALSSLRAALDAANIKRNSQAFVEAFFANDATVGGIITGRSQSSAFGGSSVPLTDTDRAGIIKQWKEQNQGARKAFRTVMLPWDLQYERIGGEPPTTQIELTDDQRRNIHQVYRVPMSMTQASDASDPLSSGSTISKDEAKFWAGWVIPEHERLLLFINASIMPWLAPGLELVGDYSDVLGMISDTAERRDMLRADVNAGLMTVNQYRESIGEEPLANGNVLYVPSGAVVTPVDEQETDDDITVSTGTNDAVFNKLIIDQMNRAMIDVYTAARLLGQTPAEELRGMYWVGNQLVPQAQLQNIWKYGTLIAPSTTNADLLVESEPEVLPTEEEVEELPLLPEPEPIPTEPNEARAIVLHEYKEWHNFTKKRTKSGKFRAFNHRAIPQEWVDETQSQILKAGGDLDEIDRIFIEAMLFHKTAQSRLLKFQDDFEDWMKQVANGKLTGARATNILNNLWAVQGRLMFSEGLIDGGILDGRPDEAERQKIQRLISQQRPFIRRLRAELAAGNVTPQQRKGKVQSWGNQFTAFYQEGLTSAKKNQMLEMTGEDGKNSCRTCRALKGQVHRAIAWEVRQLRPGIDHHNYECGTFENCHHILVPTKSGAKGTLPTEGQVRAWAAKSCDHDHNHDDAPPLEEQPYTIEQYDMYYETEGYTLEINNELTITSV